MRIPHPEIIRKVCLLGDAASEKTALIRPLIDHATPHNYITTIGAKVTTKSIDYDSEFAGGTVHTRLTLLLWDILGQEQYSRLRPAFYQGANAGIVACKADRPDAAASVRSWAETFRGMVGDVPLLILVNGPAGSATDQLRLPALDAVASEPHAALSVTSAETPHRTEQALVELGGVLVRNYLAGAVPAPGPSRPAPRASPQPRSAWFARLRRRRSANLPASAAADAAPANDSQAKHS